MFGQLFKQADSEGLGVVTGEVAVKFFERTRLPPAVLGKVRENHGRLHLCLWAFSRHVEKNALE